VAAGLRRATAAVALATAEGVRPQSMGTALAHLEQMGLIVRTPDPTDGWRQLIELTPVGRERLEGVRRAREERLVTSFQSEFTEDERQLITPACRRLRVSVAVLAMTAPSLATPWFPFRRGRCTAR
jgi:DNA-binding MarR family transcriptional regulator